MGEWGPRCSSAKCCGWVTKGICDRRLGRKTPGEVKPMDGIEKKGDAKWAGLGWAGLGWVLDCGWRVCSLFCCPISVLGRKA